jgi:hypothetical protein
MASSGPKLVVVRLDDGAEVWSDALVREQGAYIGSPIIVGRTVDVVSRTLAGTGRS